MVREGNNATGPGPGRAFGLRFGFTPGLRIPPLPSCSCSCLRLHDHAAAVAHLRAALAPEVTWPHEDLRRAVLHRACAVVYRHAGEAEEGGLPC